MKTIIRYTLLTASRDWLFIGLVAIVLMAYGLSVFVGGTALSEQQQMSLAYFAGSARMALIAGLVVFVCFHVRRAFENREIESILSKPVSRAEFVISYWLGFAFLSLLAAVPVAFIMLVMFRPDLTGFFLWISSFMLEAALVVAFALVAALVLRSAVSAVMASFAFYIVSRLMGFFVAALGKPTLMATGEIGQVMGKILTAISTIIPRLDLFAKSSWLVYGTQGATDLWVYPLQSAIFISLLLSMAVFDFKRKEF